MQVLILQQPLFLVPQRTFGGDKRDRTADLLNAIQAIASKNGLIGHFFLIFLLLSINPVSTPKRFHCKSMPNIAHLCT